MTEEDKMDLARTVVSDIEAEGGDEEIVTRYLHRLRVESWARPVLKETLMANIPPLEMLDDVLQAVSDIVIPGTESQMEKAARVFLSELVEQKASGRSSFLIDRGTGRTIMPITKEMIYTPPDYVGEDGMVHKGRPILHPGISSGLALAQQERNQEKALLAKAAEAGNAKALAHVTDPDGIVASAVEKLREVGVSVEPGLEGEDVDVEFGHESREAEYQSLNPAFHRSALYAAVLATKVRKLVGESGSCSIGPIRMIRLVKTRHYTVTVTVRRAPELTS